MTGPDREATTGDPSAAPTVLVTGATDGLGRGIAEALVRRGATVLVHGRNQMRLDRTVAELRSLGGPGTVRSYRADFAVLAEVREMAGQIRAAEPRLDVLVNNAGLGVEGRRQTSADGHELTFQVDYLAPYLLTHTLLPLLIVGAPSRIVSVTSAGQAPIDFDDVMLTRSFSGVQAYCQAKLAEIAMTFDLATTLAGTGVTANCLHPASYMPTKIVTGRFTVRDSLDDGIANTIRLITDPDLADVTGVYFDHDRPARALDQAYDLAARARLDTLARRLTGLMPPGS